jgi:hypothetical protein
MKFTNVLLALAILISSQLACQTLIPTPQATITPSPIPTTTSTPIQQPTQSNTTADISQFSDDEIKAGIQSALDLYAEAYSQNKPELLEESVDQENKPFRRIVRSRFDDYQASYVGGQIQFQYDLLDITRREFGFVIAHFESQNGYQASWPFRYTGDHWAISEPTVEQIGAPVTTETDNFIFTTYPWSDDVNQKIMDMMETARDNVKSVLGKAPEEKSNVSIMPIYGLQPFNPMNAIALYNGSGIEVYAPDSFAYSFYDPDLGWDGELQRTLTHEYTHLVHARSFDGAGRLADWMSEGLAEYVSGVAKENTYWACDAVNSGTFIPILDESGVVRKQDLMHMYSLEKNFGLSYDFATSLVQFTVDKYGGLDGFWKLANALDDSGDFKKAVQKAFGIPYDEYNTKWQKWLKDQC